MKKLLNISVIAALAILPMAANAATGDVIAVADPAHANSATAASTEPGYALAVEAASDGNLATASYVKGAYNQAMKAINKVATTASSAVQSVAEGSTNGTVAVDGIDVAVHGLGSAAYTDSTAYATAAQGALAASAVQSVAEGSTNGTVAVDGTDVAVHGLGSAAYTASTAYATAAQGEKADQAALDIGTMSSLTGTADTLVGAIEEVRTTASNALTSSSLTDYAKKTGVTQTITNSQISGTVPTVIAWGTETTGTAPITATIAGATYAEPAQQG